MPAVVVVSAILEKILQAFLDVSELWKLSTKQDRLLVGSNRKANAYFRLTSASRATVQEDIGKGVVGFCLWTR